MMRRWPKAFEIWCQLMVRCSAAVLFFGWAPECVHAQSVVADLMQVSTASSNFGYGAVDTNSCAIAHNNLITFGNHQYVAFYGPTSGGANSIFVSRRTLGTSVWTTPINTGLSITDVSDDHNVIAMGIDAN